MSDFPVLRRFVAADPVVFAEAGNRAREQRIEAGGEFRVYPVVAGAAVPVDLPRLTVEDVAAAQVQVRDLLAEYDAQAVAT